MMKNRVTLQAGVVLYMCLCGYEPFYGMNENELLAANKAAVVEFHLPEWRDVSQGARDLVSGSGSSDNREEEMLV